MEKNTPQNKDVLIIKLQEETRRHVYFGYNYCINILTDTL